ncbi:MAG: phytoene desaturase family protein, partial [Rhizobiaceae bacterium]
HSYEQLLGETQRGSQVAAKLKRHSYSMSLFVIYFGLKGEPDDLKHHMVLFGNRYRELISEIFSGPDLPEDFSLYLHCPTVSDDSLAPKGHSAYYVLSPVPHLGNANIDWDKMGPVYRDRILAYLENQCIPDLNARLVTSSFFTPKNFKTELNSHLGSAFSVEPRLTQSAWFRPHNRDAKFKNLYFVGAGTHPGAGIPGVVGSAKATASLMLQDRE